MTQATWTHQIRIFVPSSVDKEEIANVFPYRDNDQLGSTATQVLIHLTGNLSNEQLNWLRLQRKEGKVTRWWVLPQTRM